MTQNEDEISSSTASGAAYGLGIPAISAGVMEALHPSSSVGAFGTKLTASTTIGGYGASALAFTGGAVAAFLSGGLIQRNAKTAKQKALGKGMSTVGGVATIAGTVTTLGLAGWPLLLSVFGGSVALFILNAIIAGNTTEAEEIIKDKVGEEKGEKIMKEIQKGLEEKKEKIRV